jgi:glutathione S-transferase
MFGQLGHFFEFAKGKTDDYGEERYGKEVNRLLGVLGNPLADGRDWIADAYWCGSRKEVSTLDAACDVTRLPPEATRELRDSGRVNSPARPMQGGSSATSPFTTTTR